LEVGDRSQSTKINMEVRDKRVSGAFAFACALARRTGETKMKNKMTREQALRYVSLAVDDALSERSIDEMPDNARLIGWQCGFEPMFVAVWSYLDLELDDQEAEELATELLIERKWFADGKPVHADYII
jgi:hypothetical protein